MLIKQISIFVENKSGRLKAIADIIGGAGVDIRALSLADTRDFGVLRLIVDAPEKALEVLKAEGITVSTNDVIAIETDDTPGGFSRAVAVLSGEGIAIEYMYAFAIPREARAYAVLRVEDTSAALAAFERGGVRVLAAAEIYGK